MIKILVLILIKIGLCSALCPNPEVVTPCVCEGGNAVYCRDITTEFDLRAVFNKINANVANGQKNWGYFYLGSTKVREFPANVFGEITFQVIQLANNPNLAHIHPLAFVRSSFTLQTFISDGTPLSSSGDKDIDFFDALSRCPDLQTVIIRESNLTSIPDNAFHPINGEFTKLSYIAIENNPIKTIGENAFYYIPNFSELKMSFNKFTQIKRDTFTIRDHSTKKGQIFLQGVPLTENSFDPLSLTRIRRPVMIRLFYNNITSLPETVFAPFFELNPQNQIDIEGNKIQCDCRIKWIISHLETYKTGKIAGAGDMWNCKLTNC